MSEQSPKNAAYAPWQAPLRALAAEDGFVKDLGPHYTVFYSEAGSNLLVLFEDEQTLIDLDDHLPPHWQMARQKGWSILLLTAAAGHFWQSPELTAYFDELCDSSFFEDFDRTLFHGHEKGAYGAAIYSVAAPGAKVILTAPRATFDPSLLEGQEDNPPPPSQEITNRYSYGPDMIDAAAAVWLFYDPRQELDLEHIALFDQSWVNKYPLYHSGNFPYQLLQANGVLSRIIALAFDDQLNPQSLAQALRGRRETAAYLRALLDDAQRKNQLWRQYLICTWVCFRYKNLPRFRRHLRHLRNMPELSDKIAQEKARKRA